MKKKTLSPAPSVHNSSTPTIASDGQESPILPAPHDALRLYDIRYLSEDEINILVDELDHNGDGWIDYSEVERELDNVHEEIAPKPQPFNLHHPSRDAEDRHALLRRILGTEDTRISREHFKSRVREWQVPSMKQEQFDEEAERAYIRSLPRWRRLRSWWSVRGPEIMFIGLVVIMELAFGIWQFVKYFTGPYRPVFGWGVVVAKTCAGFLYPTIFFMVLSMSRYFSTIFRRSYYISKFINWDLSQTFHIRMSILCLGLATLHAIGHLGGTFVFGSMTDRSAAVSSVLKSENPPHTYHEFMASRSGWSGVSALGMFWLVAGLSMPRVRRWNYEVFQLGHLLMFPIIALLCAHGTSSLLQWPMLGYFLAIPTLLVLVERIGRVFVGFHPIDATIQILDSQTVEICAPIPRKGIWTYHAGQFVFLQVPRISRWQWHPFTVSSCDGKVIWLHIKTDGDWTSRVRGLAEGVSGDIEEKNGIETETKKSIKIGLNGPFGAPAQRFYDFSHTILVGSGIGVTPFSGILADLQRKEDQELGGPEQSHGGLFRYLTRRATRSGSGINTPTSRRPSGSQTPKRRGSRPEEHKYTFESKDEKDNVDLALPVGIHTPKRRGSRPENFRHGSDILEEGDINDPAVPVPATPCRIARAITRLKPAGRFAPNYRRVDFHWMVRDRNHLLWFSNLLNRVSKSQTWHVEQEISPRLDIRIHTHVTQKRNQLTTHVYRWLLEKHRTKEQPTSTLTGLINPTHFGRPDFIRILDTHYEDMKRYVTETGATEDKLKVGVFFCGAPVIGEILADRCRLLTAKGANEGCRIQYIFMTEVFN